MLKLEFPTSISWFDNYILWLDSGFQGFDDHYQTKILHLSLRRKRAKKGEKSQLTQQQIIYNRSVAKERIYIEHAIGGMKRYRILYNRIRIKNDNIIDQIINVTAGLWNFSTLI
jgi:hypothetical protein